MQFPRKNTRERMIDPRSLRSTASVGCCNPDRARQTEPLEHGAEGEIGGHGPAEFGAGAWGGR
ncbi:MAG: hypothetical protein JWM27_1019 [Gemmatimonadetes bacterium]|nr:hypothetical protein [Gemmatimonadota bacterium]